MPGAAAPGKYPVNTVGGLGWNLDRGWPSVCLKRLLHVK